MLIINITYTMVTLSFSKINCKRLKLNQNSFVERLHESALKLKKEKYLAILDYLLKILKL